MIVRFSTRAREDLDEIEDWIARDDPIRASTFVQELIDVAEALGEFPRAYPPVPRLGPLARHRTYGNYLILYDVEEEEVVVTAIVHGARDLDALF